MIMDLEYLLYEEKIRDLGQLTWSKRLRGYLINAY